MSGTKTICSRGQLHFHTTTSQVPYWLQSTIVFRDKYVTSKISLPMLSRTSWPAPATTRRGFHQGHGVSHVIDVNSHHWRSHPSPEWLVEPLLSRASRTKSPCQAAVPPLVDPGANHSTRSCMSLTKWQNGRGYQAFQKQLPFESAFLAKSHPSS